MHVARVHLLSKFGLMVNIVSWYQQGYRQLIVIVELVVSSSRITLRLLHKVLQETNQRNQAHSQIASSQNEAVTAKILTIQLKEINSKNLKQHFT